MQNSHADPAQVSVLLLAVGDTLTALGHADNFNMRLSNVLARHCKPCLEELSAIGEAIIRT
jgi:hypothetical protein